MPHKIRPTLTLARRAWLEQLEGGPAKRRRGRAGFDCMTLGWTDWLLLDTISGQRITMTEAQAAHGKPIFVNAPHISFADNMEIITDEGRRVLAEARSADK